MKAAAGLVLLLVHLASSTRENFCKESGSEKECDGHGLCKLTAEGDTCFCNPGRVGPYCQILECEQVCSTGKCGPDQQCLCPPGLGGALCDTPKDCGGCSGHGKCAQLSSKDLTEPAGNVCLCNTGWMGDDCSMQLCPVFDTPKGPQICGGHERGRCIIGGVCGCKAAYRGDNCGETACTSGCNGRGKCIKPGLCLCETGFFGEDCELKRCPLDCSNRGDCQPDGTCDCDEGWLTATCSVKACPMECNADLGWGACIDHHHCKCTVGMGGINCATNFTQSVPVLGDADQVYDPCKLGCPNRCDATCVPPEHHTFLLGPGRMLRSQIPRKQLNVGHKLCLENCELDCKRRCLQKLEALSDADRKDHVIELPSLKGKVNLKRPLEGELAKDIFKQEEILSVGASTNEP